MLKHWQKMLVESHVKPLWTWCFIRLQGKNSMSDFFFIKRLFQSREGYLRFHRIIQLPFTSISCDGVVVPICPRKKLVKAVAIAYWSEISSPSISKTEIRFLHLLQFAEWWKNIVLWLPPLNHCTLALCVHIVSSEAWVYSNRLDMWLRWFLFIKESWRE